MSALKLLKLQEGFRPYIYDDRAKGAPELKPGDTLIGSPTFGYGFRTIDREDADYMLPRKIAQVSAALRQVIPVYSELNSCRQFALVSMAYQQGVAGLLGYRKMLSAIAAKDWSKAHDEALDSLWAKQTPARAKEIALMLLTGEWPPRVYDNGG